jgi:hypothetical protein
MIRNYRIFADYHQFYLWDRCKSPPAPTSYSEEDVRQRIKVSDFVIVVQPERDTEVPVEVEIRSEAPRGDLDSWDHVAEASIEIPSGELEIHECTGGSVDVIALAPGWYRARAHFGGLGTLTENGLSGSDHYRIVMWPAPQSCTCVLKQFNGLRD